MITGILLLALSLTALAVSVYALVVSRSCSREAQASMRRALEALARVESLVGRR